MTKASGAAREIESNGDGASVASVAAPDPLLSKIRTDFEDYGLNGYQAKVLLALLRAGSAAPPHLAQLSGVHRTSAYPTLEELRSKGLAFQLPGRTAVWSTPGRDEVLDRLLSAQEERLRLLQAKKTETAKALATVIPDETAQTSTVPHIQFVSSASQARTIYERLLGDADEEFLVLNRPPYSVAASRSRRERALTDAINHDEVNPAVIEALDRGVSIRVLYQAAQWDDPEAAAFRDSMTAYHEAGVVGAILDDLPMKLVVADRRVCLLALADPVAPEIGFPANLLVEHPGYAAFQAAAFDHLWSEARLLEVTPRAPRRRRRSRSG